MLDDFVFLIFPKVCYGCGKSLYKKEHYLCMHCLYHLPKTNFHIYDVNPVSKLFWGRVEVVAATSFLLFQKGGKVQRLLHEFKYRGKKEIGIFLGKQYGKMLMESPIFRSVELIIPVPLHYKKWKERGYNQSEYFALGLAETMKKDINTALMRIHASDTQTHKSRFERWENVEQIFQLTNPEQIKGKHVLLVDDVVTTGATLEACAREILRAPGTKVSITTLAYACIT